MRSHGDDLVRDSFRPRGDRMTEPDAGSPNPVGVEGVRALQRSAGNAAVSGLLEDEPSPVLDVVGSGGRALDPALRADMEGRFGTDFSDVRVHTDDRAHRSAESVSAQAYTVGSDLVFRQGQYDPSSDAGRHLLAHELTHVVQQRNGPVDGTDAGGGVRLSDPGDRFEREASANADRVMSGAAPAVTDGGAAVQREEMPEDEEQIQPSLQRVEDESQGPDELRPDD